MSVELGLSGHLNVDRPLPRPERLAARPISHETGASPLAESRGLLSWLFTLDHRRVGVMYLAAVVAALAMGGAFAVALRAQARGAGAPSAGAMELYNHLFTLHGVVMVFLFALPAIPAALGSLILPTMLRARSLAFPRLSLAALHLHLLGAGLLLYVLGTGVLTAFDIHMPGGWGLDTGAAFSAPYSTARAAGAVLPAALGILFVALSAALNGVNVLATVRRARATTFSPLSTFASVLCVTSVVQLLALPVLGAVLVLLGLERAGVVSTFGGFDPARGGDPLVFRNLFWIGAHPAVYLLALPAIGVVSEILASYAGYAGRAPAPQRTVVGASVALAVLGFLAWGRHAFLGGQSGQASATFSLFALLPVVPSLLCVFCWLAILKEGTASLKAPMLYALAFIPVFTIGALSGLFLGALSTGARLADTAFAAAHFHYLVSGTTLLAFLGGVYTWGPRMFGRTYHENFARLAAVVVFVGFNLAFFPQFLAGAQGLPREAARYAPEFATLHRFSTAGAHTLALGLVMVGLNWAHALRRGRPATSVRVKPGRPA